MKTYVRGLIAMILGILGGGIIAGALLEGKSRLWAGVIAAAIYYVVFFGLPKEDR